MAKGQGSNPSIRILMLGAPGTGKKCFESRFTTEQWPPSYDPSLTLCSRRFFTLRQSSSPSPHDAVQLPSPAPSQCCQSPTATLVNTPLTPWNPSFVPPTAAAAGPCAQCLQDAQTYLVELINYPALARAKVRQQVLAKGDYDAVLLVYDITQRASFEHVRTLHAELTAHRTRRGGLLGGLFSTSEAGGSAVMMGLLGMKCDVDDEEEQHDTEQAAVPQRHHKKRPARLRPISSFEAMINDRLHIDTATGQQMDGLDSGENNSHTQANRPQEAAEATGRNSRQVSTLEGQRLASEMGAQVSFMETSAKTGLNVEEAVEAVVEAVRRGRGSDGVAAETLSKTCRQRHSKLGSSISGSQDNKQQRPAQNNKEATFHSVDLGLEQRLEQHAVNEVSRYQQVRRQDSMGEKMRNFCFRKHAPTAPGMVA